MITILNKLFVLLILLIPTVFCMEANYIDKNKKASNKIIKFLGDFLKYEEQQIKALEEKAKTPYISQTNNITLMCYPLFNIEKYIKQMQKNIIVFNDIQKQSLDLRFSATLTHLTTFLISRYKFIKTGEYIPHDEIKFNKQYASYENKSIVEMNNILRMINKRKFDTMIEILRLSYKGLSLHSQYEYSSSIIYFSKLADYFINKKPIISDDIVEIPDFKAKMDMVVGVNITNFNKFNKPLQYTVETDEKDKFFLSFFKNKPFKRLQFMNTYLGFNPTFVLHPLAEQFIQHKMDKQNNILPLFAELGNIQSQSCTEAQFKWQPKKLLYQSEHSPQKQQNIAKIQLNDNTQIKLPEISLDKKITEYMGENNKDPLYIECQNMIKAVQEWVIDGCKSTNKIHSSVGDWSFEQLHKNKNSKKLNATNCIKSREQGNMPWYERIYFRIEEKEKGTKNIIFTKIGHI